MKIALRWFKVAFSLFLIGLGVCFFYNNRNEFLESLKVVSHVQPYFLVVAFVFMLVHNLAQSIALEAAFNCVNKKMPILESVKVYLKRFFLSPFIPGGFSVAQYTFASDLHKLSITTAESAFASSVFVLGGLFSFILLLIPTYILALFSDNISQKVVLASVNIVIFAMIISIVGGYIFRKKIVYRIKKWLEPYITETAFRPAKKVVLICIFIDLTGMIMLWLSLQAFGYNIGLATLLLTYVAEMLVISFSPLFSGAVLAEGSLVYLLAQSGIPGGGAVAAVIVFRFFQFWLPLIIGGGVYLWDLKKHLPPATLAFFGGNEVEHHTHQN